LREHDLGATVVDAIAQRFCGKPPNTTVCGAPMRAQASMPTTTSGTMPM
jgi:hypothetical protein